MACRENLLVPPGEKCEVKLEIYVDKKTAHLLNCGKDKLYDILVLHLLGGKDIFITVRCCSRNLFRTSVLSFT